MKKSADEQVDMAARAGIAMVVRQLIIVEDVIWTVFCFGTGVNSAMYVVIKNNTWIIFVSFSSL